MFASNVLGALAVLAATATAQEYDTSTRPTATTRTSTWSGTNSSRTGPATVTIAVGAEGHVFTPKEVTANTGDIIKFNFYPGGHRVARAEFGWPCIPYEYANINKAGFYTGIFTPQVVSNNPPSYSIRVNNSEPIFFYCAAPGSCVDYHMIGVINPNATQTLEAQLGFAKKATYQLAPGDPFPSETPVPRPTPGSGSTQPDPTSTAGAGTGNRGDGGGGGGLSPGAIAGIAIGGAAVLILAALLIYLCGRRGGFDKAYRKSGIAGMMPPQGQQTAGPDMVEANYPSGFNHPKSPGQMTQSSFGGHDGSTLRGSFHGVGGGGGSAGMPHFGTNLSPAATSPGYGFAVGGHGGHGGDGMYSSPQSSPRADQYTGFVPPLVELPTGDAPAPTQSPPPGYQQDTHHRPGSKS